MQTFTDILTLVFFPQFDYNSTVVVVGVIVYSIGCVLIGNFMILQKRSLLADVLSHAAFPGIVLIFIFMVLLGAQSLSKNLLILLIGAFVSTILAIYFMKIFLKHTHIKPDAIQASILGIFFGVGVAMLGIAQGLSSGSTAGMFTYIYGSTASMQLQDAYLFIISSSFILLYVLYHKKKITILCFDLEYAYSLGIKSGRLDFMLLLLIVMQVIVGIQAIGLLMVSAMFIVPVIIAKFWTERLNTMIWLSIIFSILGGYIGAIISSNSVSFPTGAVIVTVLEIFFIFSIFFGSKKGILTKLITRTQFLRKVNFEHTLRIIRELIEYKEAHTQVALTENSSQYQKNTHVLHTYELQELLYLSHFAFNRRLRAMQRKDYLVLIGNTVELTEKGRVESKRILRNHRLWEVYLLHYTDASPDDVDYSADKVEHILGYEFTQELEAISLELTHKNQEGGIDSSVNTHNTLPSSPHSNVFPNNSRKARKEGGI